MYQVNIGDKIIYYPGSDDAEIYDTQLNEEVGLAGEFKFKVPPTNPYYSLLTSGALVTILKDKKEFWRGEIRDVKHDFSKVASVYVLEDIAWLGDEFIAPAKVTTETYAQRFNAAITAYNQNRTAERQFSVGVITNLNDSDLCNWTTEYEWSILDSLRNCICKENGYIKIRRQYESGVLKRYIDIVRLEDYGRAATQPIEYGYNLLDYVKESDYGNLTNVLTPYGDEKEDDSEVYEDYSERIQGDTIANIESINTYGRHAKAVIFNGASDLDQLNALASAYLLRYCQPQLTMEVQAIDLSMVEDVEEIKIGDSIRVMAKPFLVDQRLFMTQIERDIQNPDKNIITLSGNVVRKTLTSRVIDTMTAVEDIPEESSILKAAKRNALNLLLDETQSGFVVYEYDANNKYIIAINICNARTIAASTKRWRWSQTGFGYMERADTQSDWSGADAKIAITMNGQIVANYITTGTMYADRIRGGTLALGGSNNANGVMRIYNASGSEVGNWSNAGINVLSGVISGPTIYAGKADDASGKIIVYDSNNSVKVRLDANGLWAEKGTIAGFEIKNNELDNHDESANGNHTVIHTKNGFSFARKFTEDDTQTWGKFNTYRGSDKFRVYCHNGAFVVDNDGSLPDTESNASLWVRVGSNNVSRKNGDTVTWSGSSDKRLKKNIKDITDEEVLGFFEKLKPKRFQFNGKNGADTKPIHFGVIAQDLDFDFDNNFVSETEDKYLFVNYVEFCGMELAAIKYLMKEVAELKELIKKEDNNG